MPQPDGLQGSSKEKNGPLKEEESENEVSENEGSPYKPIRVDFSGSGKSSLSKR